MCPWHSVRAHVPSSNGSIGAHRVDLIASRPPVTWQGELLVVDFATGQRRWQVMLANDYYSSVAHLDGTIVPADGEHTRGYSIEGTGPMDRAVARRSPARTG
jgi:hypothetical protein